jgi:hypothetical protein
LTQINHFRKLARNLTFGRTRTARKRRRRRRTARRTRRVRPAGPTASPAAM